MRQRGFVLVAALVVLAVFALVVGHFAGQVVDAVNLAQRASQRTQAMIEMEGVRADILFRLAVTPMSIFGLGLDPRQSVALDGRPYRASADVVLSVQDDRGLLNLNAVNADRLRRFLGILGVEPQRRSRLVDTLMDYVDADDLKHLNGAEAADYLAANLEPPTNKRLRTPAEIRRVMDWAGEEALWEEGRLLSLVSCSYTAGVNLNTARLEVLATLPGVTADVARAVIDARQTAPLTDGTLLSTLTGRSSEEYLLSVINFPINALRVTLRHEALGWQVSYAIALTPMSKVAPWRIDYLYRVPADAPSTPSLPPLPPWFPGPPPAASILSTP